MKVFKIIFIAALMANFSCVKKITQVDRLNTNVFDEDYAGEQWFEVVEAYEYYNTVGQLKAHFKVEIPKENLPQLRPSIIELNVKMNEGGYAIIDSDKNSNGDYDFERDFSPSSSGTYCIDIGLYDDVEDRTLNNFIECVDL